MLEFSITFLYLHSRSTVDILSRTGKLWKLKKKLGSVCWKPKYLLIYLILLVIRSFPQKSLMGNWKKLKEIERNWIKFVKIDEFCKDVTKNEWAWHFRRMPRICKISGNSWENSLNWASKMEKHSQNSRKNQTMPET